MSDVITRNTPVSYRLRRVAFQLDANDDIGATADLTILNADGDIIDQDHPATTLTAGEEATFRAWVLAQLAAYETATGLTRDTGG